MAVNSRTLHRWLTVLVALPFGVILLSGLLLQTRSFNTWLQTAPAPVTAGGLNLSFDMMLSRLREIPEAGVQSWNDVKQIDIRPDKGHIRVRSKKNFTEVQFSPSGDVLQVAPRRTSWIISIHDGAYFGETMKWWVFIPASLALLVMYFTGLWLFVKPWLNRSPAKRSSPYAQPELSFRP